MSGKYPYVAAVMVSWNLKERVLEGIAALCADAAIGKVILVDNASNDGTPEEVAQRFPDVEIIRNEKNIGYAAGNNVGMRYAMELNADYVLLLNSDALPEPGATAALINAAIETNAGVVGGKPIRRSDPKRLDAAWGVINWRNMASRLEGESALDGPEFSTRRDVDYPLGVAFLIKIKALRDVGLFDETYFAYHEEMDLCERMRRSGYRVVYEPARFLHGGSESLKRAGASLGRHYLLARNSVRFINKFANTPNKIKFWMFVVAASFLKLPIDIVRGETKSHFAKIAGWMDGLAGKSLDDKTLKKWGFL